MASIIIIAVVFVLDVLAFVLAIGAERRRSYVREHSLLIIPFLLLIRLCSISLPSLG